MATGIQWVRTHDAFPHAHNGDSRATSDLPLKPELDLSHAGSMQRLRARSEDHSLGDKGEKRSCTMKNEAGGRTNNVKRTDLLLGQLERGRRARVSIAFSGVTRRIVQRGGKPIWRTLASRAVPRSSLSTRFLADSLNGGWRPSLCEQAIPLSLHAGITQWWYSRH